MLEQECLPAKTARKTPIRWRGFSSVRAAVLLGTSASAAALIGMAAPVHAEPTDPYVYVAGATDDTFLRALDGLGIAHPDNVDAVNVARGACTHIQGGHSVREAVDGVRNTYPGLPLLQGAHFVAVARALYCPNSSNS